MEIGLITPPVGLNLFVTSAVTGMPLSEVIKAAMPWLVALRLLGDSDLCTKRVAGFTKVVRHVNAIACLSGITTADCLKRLPFFMLSSLIHCVFCAYH